MKNLPFNDAEVKSHVFDPINGPSELLTVAQVALLSSRAIVGGVAWSTPHSSASASDVAGT
jgi:hypothetical protein